MVAAEGNGGEDIFFVARNDDADWDLAVIGAVGSVESAATGVEADFSAEMAAESGFKRGGVELRGMRRGGAMSCGIRYRTSWRMRTLGARQKVVASLTPVPGTDSALLVWG